VPIYEYKCKKCGHLFEKLHQSFSEARVKKCPECGGKVEQLFSAPAAHFKGEGFYATDYARKGAKPSEGGESAKPETKSETKSESKSESKAESKSESKADKKPKK
jgi:putative FmdB family regulatory protein